MKQDRTLSSSFLALILLSLSLFSLNAQAQSIADNIRPVGQVCMAGQPCVGTMPGAGNAESAAPAATASTASANTTPANTAPAPAPTAPANIATAATTDDSFDAAAAYQMSCFACHGTGAAGAPELGDDAVWEERMAKGMDAVMDNVINGIGAMPARGICMSCSDENLRELVDYMLAQ